MRGCCESRVYIKLTNIPTDPKLESRPFEVIHGNFEVAEYLCNEQTLGSLEYCRTAAMFCFMLLVLYSVSCIRMLLASSFSCLRFADTPKNMTPQCCSTFGLPTQQSRTEGKRMEPENLKDPHFCSPRKRTTKSGHPRYGTMTLLDIQPQGSFSVRSTKAQDSGESSLHPFSSFFDYATVHAPWP